MAKPVFTLGQITTQLRTQWGGSQEGHTWSWLGTSNVTYSMPSPGPAGQSESAGYVAIDRAMQDRLGWPSNSGTTWLRSR